LLKSDANEAAQYLQSELVNLTPNYSTPSVDIIHSGGRIKLFEEKAADNNKWFIQTGFEELDDIVCGWQMGEEFVVIYARTGNGKSWVLVKSMQHAWLMGKNVGYISPEMSADKIGYRFDTLNHHFSNTALTRGNQSIISLDTYNAYFEEISKQSNKFLVATPIDFNKQITVSKLRTWITKNKLDVLAIDGITYLSDERYKKGDNKTITLTNISEDLMQLSEELHIPILVVVQSNRGGVKEDENATPELEDIRDGDGISHNATKVISLRKKDDALLMVVKKNRDGLMGTKLEYQWDPDTGDFSFISSEKDRKREQPKQQLKKEEGKVAF
jgi:replicative DNA helicase